MVVGLFGGWLMWWVDVVGGWYGGWFFWWVVDFMVVEFIKSKRAFGWERPY